MRGYWLVGFALTLTACTNSVELTATKDSCRGCHQPDNAPGIEVPHLGYALSCTDCHGGNSESPVKASAHVVHDGAKNLRPLSPAELDKVPAEYMRFVNPSDYRVVDVGCGSKNPQSGNGGGCHQDIIEKSKRSVHATLSGQTAIPRFNAGLQPDRLAVYGPLDIEGVAPGLTEPRAVDVVDRIQRLPPPPDLKGKGKNDFVDFHTTGVAKGCPICHTGNFGGGSVGTGTWRSSGCASCHMVYEEDGKSRSDDPMIDRNFPAHPAKHEIIAALPDKACETCHFRGNRVGPAYKGWRERPGSSKDTNKATTLRNTAPVHSRPAEYWIYDEDTTNDIDETPPDIHFTKGLTCIDCHIERDVHGDGYIHSTMDLEMGMECEDCHGTFDRAIQKREGKYWTTGGDVLKHVKDGTDGAPKMTALVSGKEHPLTQIVNLAKNADLDAAHSTANHGEMECYTCHTAWSMNCYGCHTTFDMRQSAGNPIHGGAATTGRVSGSQDVVTLDNLHLGINSDGKIGVLMVQNLFQTVIVPCDPVVSTATCGVDRMTLTPGRKLVNSKVRRSVEGKLGFSWGPAVPHTTATKEKVQPCARCHPKRDGSNRDMIRVTYGFGDGKYKFTEGETGIEYDLTRAMSEDGTPDVAFAHPKGPGLPVGPVPIARVRKAMAYEVP